MELYIVTITENDGRRHVEKTNALNFYGLTRALDKGEIKAFSIRRNLGK